MKEMVVVDTNIVSDLFKGDRSVAETLSSCSVVYLSAIVIGELLYGFAKCNRESKNRTMLDTFIGKPNVRLLDCTAAIAERYARIRKKLSDAGTLIPTNDTWIAAQAIEAGAAVYSRDAHFSQVQGLEVRIPS